MSEYPPLIHIHSDREIEVGIGRFSLVYWRGRPTKEILASLKSGKPEALRVKSDGRIMNGNIRVKALEERGFDLNDLPREIV